MAGKPTAQAVVRAQTRAALFFLGAMVFVLGTLAALTRSAAVQNWIEAKRMEFSRQTKRVYSRSGYFQTPNEVWMYDELPHADFSKGGVYFLGASDVMMAMAPWALPPALQGLVHNYGVGTCNHQGDMDLIRYLVEDRGLLKAGGEKTMVVIGLSYGTACVPGRTVNSIFINEMERHDLFTFDAQGRLHGVPMNPLLKFFDFEQTHYGALMTRASELISEQISRWRHHGVQPVRVHNPEAYRKQHDYEMGPGWQKEIDDSAPVLRELIQYLKARHVEVRVILMFQASWNDSLPYPAEYLKQVTAVCDEEHVPIIDWSKMLTDDEFADSTHPNLDGMAKTHAAFLKIAVPFLRSTGALPENINLPEFKGFETPGSPKPNQ